MGSGQRRRSPTSYRRRSSAFTWFALCLLLLIAVGALFYQFVLKFDFEGYSPGEYPLLDFVPEEGYQPVSYPPRPYAENGEPTPEPIPTPRPTAIPIDKYSMLDKRMLMPKTGDVVLCGLTECRISMPDDSRALVVQGWGYLSGQDAANSEIYLVVSTKYGETHRFYEARLESGCTGLVHDPATGRNLDRADFTAAVRIEDTYIDGDYRLGVLVVNGGGKKQVRGYARLDHAYDFNVVNGRITSLAG